MRRFPGEIHYLPNEHGKLVPVPNFTIDGWHRAVLRDHGMDAEDTPAQSISRIKLTGSVSGSIALLEVEYEIRVLVASSESQVTTRVPLGLSDAVFDGAARHDGPGKFLLSADPERGYVCRLLGPPDSSHTLRMKIRRKLDRVGDEAILNLALPRAASSFDLQVPMGRVQAWTDDANIVSTKQINARQSQIVVGGMGGDLKLHWRPVKTQTAAALKLDVNGRIRYAIKDPQSFQCDADLTVRSFGDKLDTFEVLLPTGFVLESRTTQPGYRLEVIRSDQPGPQRVRVTLSNNTTAEATVRLEAGLLLADAKPDEPRELSGLQVIGAVRQQGIIDVEVVEPWSVEMSAGAHVSTTDSVTRFEYHEQPFQLSAKVAARKTRLRVLPSHQLDVLGPQLVLRSTLEYEMLSGSISSAVIDLAGWQVLNVEPDSVVKDHEAITNQETKRRQLVIQLDNEAILNGAFSLELVLGQARQMDGRQLSVQLPQPTATDAALTRLPAALQVSALPNIQLTPDLDRMANLVTVSTNEPTGPEAEVFSYRQTNVELDARFVADLQTLQQWVAVDVRNEITFEQERVRILQTFDHVVAYEALTNIHLAVPQSIAADATNRLSVRVNGQRLPALLQFDGEEFLPGDEQTTARIALPRGLYGEVKLEVEYSLPLPVLNRESKINVDIPLVSVDPAAVGSIHVQPLTVVYPGNLLLGSDAGDWNPVVDRAGDGLWRSEILLDATDEMVDRIAFQLRLTEPDEQTTITILRGWMQTWLTLDQRQDRFACQLVTNQDHVDIELPPESIIIRSADIDAFVNNQRVEPVLIANRRIRIPVAQSADEQSLVIRYQFAGRAAVGRLNCQPPRVLGTNRIREMYWQLVTPSNEHLLVEPDNMTALAHWQWTGTNWDRQATLSQQHLDEWIGIEREMFSPGPSSNQYLFASFGLLNTYYVRTVRKSTVLLISGIAAFGFGLAFLRFGWLRHPAALLVSGVAIGLVAIWSPRSAAFFGQWIFVGVCLLILFRFLDGIVNRQHPPRRMRPRPPADLAEPAVELSDYAPAAGDGNATTATMSMSQHEA